MTTIEPLLEGFRRFRAEHFERHPQHYRSLVSQGQHPLAAVVCCADARVDPAILLGAGPGDLFVIRNVANLVPPYQPDEHHHGTSAALEFAVRDLRVPNLVVLGHAYCGGIRATIDTLEGHPPDREFLVPWIDLARPACEAALAECDHDGGRCGPRAECQNVAQSLRRLRTFPWIDEQVRNGELTLHGLWFDLDHGHLHGVDPETAATRRLVPEEDPAESPQAS